MSLVGFNATLDPGLLMMTMKVRLVLNLIWNDIPDEFLGRSDDFLPR